MNVVLKQVVVIYKKVTYRHQHLAIWFNDLYVRDFSTWRIKSRSDVHGKPMIASSLCQMARRMWWRQAVSLEG
jgi:hypothetical protein